jgi:hypothetical protein
MLRATILAVSILLLTQAAFSDTSPASLDKHARQLNAKLKGRGFTVVVEKPFVVVSNESAMAARSWALVIRGTVARLKQDYFAKDPDEILEIWLLRDAASYERYAKEFFGDTPSTPYGYYSPADRALIMNISTGGGTLVHEIVHPFIEANFPNCPAWFNEGLGSLYEQSGTVNGHIYGYTNWRLPGLQRGIKQKAVPTFQTLTSTTRKEFYGDETGINYAVARYLCYYLQERKLLVRFFREFTADEKNDPTGYRTLQKVLGVRDMAAFQKTWENFVLQLVY